MIWIIILFFALLPRLIAQVAIQKWPARHGAILIVWAALSLGFVPYALFPAIETMLPYPRFATPIYFALFVALMAHFEWKYGPKPDEEDQGTDE